MALNINYATKKHLRTLAAITLETRETYAIINAKTDHCSLKQSHLGNKLNLNGGFATRNTQKTVTG